MGYARLMAGTSRPPEGAGTENELPAVDGAGEVTVRREGLPEQVDGVTVFREPDGCVVHQPAHNKVHFLNHTAAFVLELCTGDHTVGEIEEILAGFFELTEPAQEAVAAALRQLVAEGLVRIA